jgi:CCR4-NOT transcription complex subunit 9
MNMSNQLPVQNMYARGGLYSDTPPLSAPLAHPVPHQPVAQFMPNNSALAVHEDGKIYSLVIDLMDPNTREGALLELSKKREQYDDLALVLWHSFGVFLPHAYVASSLTDML